MTNWKTYKITRREDNIKAGNYIRFYLDGHVDYERGQNEPYIDLKLELPFTKWEEGDKINID